MAPPERKKFDKTTGPPAIDLTAGSSDDDTSTEPPPAPEKRKRLNVVANQGQGGKAAKEGKGTQGQGGFTAQEDKAVDKQVGRMCASDKPTRKQKALQDARRAANQKTTQASLKASQDIGTAD